MAPKTSKRSASEDSSSDSGPDDRNPPPKKTKSTNKRSTKNTNSKEYSWLLNNNRFVKVRDFKGKLFVDIREYYEKNGELLPGKKGVALSLDQWDKLKEHIDDIQEAIKTLG